jgi:hypothetical protein
MLYHATILCVMGLFRKDSHEVGKYVFLGPRRQLCCQAEGKKAHEMEDSNILKFDHWQPHLIHFPMLT